MNREEKLLLFKQLQEMSNLNEKIDAEELISEEQFLILSSHDAIKYIFKYRDTQTDFGANVYYIELPDLNMEGQDLRDIHISKFMLSRIEDGIRVQTKLNFKNTGIRINLSKVGISEQTQDEIGIKEQIIDFTYVDFTGCYIYGILPDEYEGKSNVKYKIIVKGREKLDENYLKRRNEHHLNDAQRKKSDRAYARILEQRDFAGMKGKNETIDLSDYDLSEFLDIEFLAMINAENDIILSNTGIDEDILRHATIFYIEKEILSMRPRESTYYNSADYHPKDYDRARKYSQKLLELNAEYLEEQDYDSSIISELKSKILKKQKEREIINEYDKGNMEFVESQWTHINRYIKGQIIKGEYIKGNLEFVEKYFGDINEETQREIIRSEYFKGNLEFIKRHLQEISKNLKGEIVTEEYTKGNLEFVELYFSQIDEKAKLKIITEEYIKNNIEFIERHWKDIDITKLIEIIEEEYNKGNLSFVEKFWSILDQKVQIYIIKKEYTNGNIEFIEKHWNEINVNTKSDIVKQEYSKGNMKFVKKHWNEIDEKTKAEIIKSEYSQENLEFIELFWSQIDKNTKLEILKEEFLKENITFLKKYFDEIDRNTKSKIIQEEYRKGDLEFVENYWGQISKYTREEIIIEEYSKGNIEFVKRHWEEISLGIKDKIIKQESIKIYQKKGDNSFIKFILDKEKQKTELRGKIEVNCSGKMLSEELSKEKIDKEIVLMLIEAGSGLEYETYKNNQQMIVEYIPTLYKALQIEEESVRKEIVIAMLKAGVNPDTKYVKYQYTKKGLRRIIQQEKCIEANDGELIELMEELGMDVSNYEKYFANSNNIKHIEKNKKRILQFLIQEIGLTEEEIKKLEEQYKALEKDIYKTSIETLEIQKKILDLCGATKQAFTKEIRVLTQEPQILYARYMFYKENNIPILPHRLSTTIGISRKGFTKNFGEMLLERGKMNEVDFERKVKQKLLQTYPMTKDKDDIER